MKNFERYLYLAIVLLLAVIILMDRLPGCNKKDCPPCTTAPVPTASAPVKIDTVYKPAPVAVYPAASAVRKTAMQPSVTIYQPKTTLPELTPCPPQSSEYAAIESIRLYDTTLTVRQGKDSIGFVRVQDSTRGEILARRINIQLAPVAVQIPAKKRNILKLGFEIGGQQKDWFSMYSGQAAFAFKNDNEITARITRIGNTTYYSAGHNWAIKFGKK